MTLELQQERRVAPSILSADFARLGEQVQEVLDAGARVIHVDVMDGHFVPPITMGPLVVSALREQVDAAGGMLEVHLMIERPERQVAEFARAGADLITVHAEATPHVHYAISAVREAGAGAGVAINPATPVRVLAEIAADLDLALCMTVNPGWAGQEFIPFSLDKVRRLRALIGAGIALEVDGGIDPETAGPCAQAGASSFVAGSAIFDTPDPAQAYREIAAAAGAV
ncbi:MAG TPA: ribulose-phosphate 3-epimerase [Solirubrobacteraceae bacterium]|nr:ribulose-phosphate 3-epimerase [Solirubrobacteraceae bacterium]